MPTWKQLKKNPELWEVLRIRRDIIVSIRDFFQKLNFLEVSTPILQPAVIPESYLDIFSTAATDRSGKKNRKFLIPSPEISIKKLLAAGAGNCFEISKCYRNRETGSNFHHYEFTMLEWYRTQANYLDILKDCRNLIIYIFSSLEKKYPQKYKNSLIYQNYKLDLKKPWEMLTVNKALQKYCGITFDQISVKNKKNRFPLHLIRNIAAKKGYAVRKENSWEELFNQLYLNEIELHLGTNGVPTVIYDYPAPLAALAKLKNEDKRLAERFELYLGRVELADCCSELTDFREQKRRFEENARLIKKYAKNPIIPDSDFLDALNTGLPECSGIALGIDRLVMLFTDKQSIKETYFSVD